VVLEVAKEMVLEVAKEKVTLMVVLVTVTGEVQLVM
jgi:hypothetical protein